MRRFALICLLLLGCPSEAPPDEPVVISAGGDRVVFVGRSVLFDGRGTTGGATFRWVFGDGGQTDFQDTGLAEHTYTAPGHYTAGLSVADARGRLSSVTLSVRAVLEPLGAPGRSASTVAVGRFGRRLFVPLPDFDAVAVVDRIDRAVVGHFDTCAGPRTLSAAADTDVLVVACSEADAIDVLDAAAERPEGRDSRLAQIAMPYGSRPWGAVIERNGEVGYASLQGTGEMARITLNPPALDRLGAALEDVRGLAVDDLRRYASRNRSDPFFGEWLTWEDESPGVHQLDFEPGPDSDTSTRGVPSYLQTIAVSPDGRRAAIPGLIANNARGVYRDGQSMTHETTLRAFVDLLDTDPDSETFGRAIDRLVFDDRGLASAATFSPRGDLLFVAMLGMGTVEILDAYTLQRVGAFSGVCEGPDGLWAAPEEDVLWVSCGLSRELVGLSLEDLSGLPLEVARLDLRPGGVEVLAPEVLAGKQLFYRSSDVRMTRSGYISCGVCHLDGDDDRRVWDFTDRGEGLRNTISMRGRAGDEHGPIHWSGNFDEIQDFENDIRGSFAGAGFLDEADWTETSDPLGPSKAGLSADLDTLAAYAASLDTFPRSPFREPTGFPSADAQAGAVIFSSPEADCVGCHPAPDYTDSMFLAPGEPLLHDVGTLTDASGDRRGDALLGIDTPTLRGVWSTPPYLHDGSAATLRDVLVDRNAQGLHGGAANLSAEDLNLLIRFLLELE
jgi:PKD repeat protein